ncbi:hypothetical protein [Rhizohabitans arisaemae]|nr:hypothetical protein [Rhizohabitans arisaemae]
MLLEALRRRTAVGDEDPVIALLHAFVLDVDGRSLSDSLPRL